MKKNQGASWAALAGLAAVTAGCVQILGFDKDYHAMDAGAGGATSSAGSSSSSSGSGGTATCSDDVRNGSETGTDCGGAACPKCPAGQGCLSASDCESGVCSGAYVCVPANCSDWVKNGTESDVDCGGSCPTKCALGQGCTADADCGTVYCHGAACWYKPIGAACSSPAECDPANSGGCLDGVCCASVCEGLCQACTAAKKGSGSDGTCGPIAVDTDPDDECTQDATSTCGNTGMCDGAGACQLYAAGTTCRAAAGACDVVETCPGGGAPCPANGFASSTTTCTAVSCAGNTLTPAGTCNGSGTCNPGTPVACAGGLVCADATSCKTACAADADCVLSGTYCASGTCTPKLTVGATCSGATQCTGGCCGGVCVNIATTHYTYPSCSDWAGWPMPNPSSAGLPNPSSYNTATAGVVIDNVTGLWWQQPIDVTNNQGTNCAGGCTQADALTYCANLTLAGHSDWRLPTRVELVSLVDFTRNNPAIDVAMFPSTPSSWFWTSSPWSGSSGSAWIVGFGDGYSSYAAVGDTDRVRCVR